MFPDGAGVLWEQDADPIWQICLDCEQGAVQKWWAMVSPCSHCNDVVFIIAFFSQLLLQSFLPGDAQVALLQDPNAYPMSSE